MNEYRYLGNVDAANGTISVTLDDGRSFGVGQKVKLHDWEYMELSHHYILQLVEKPRPEVAKVDVKPVGKTADKA